MVFSLLYSPENSEGKIIHLNFSTGARECASFFHSANKMQENKLCN